MRTIPTPARLASAIITLALAASLPPAARACKGGAKQQAFQKIDVEELTRLQATGPVHLYDANSEKTRKKLGVIPGATLLTSPSEYDVAKVLPKEKDAVLVFYCANVHCTASHVAAKRAIEAGYTQVYVLAPGVKGWAEAGRPVERPNS
ncbi:MAG: hypothetical protein D6729_09265 [Deltaproteobacteria bacterium]|nr:MAG: hypothetical protein D6729_09265 [Deltaproteobacteria bacterium]